MLNKEYFKKRNFIMFILYVTLINFAINNRFLLIKYLNKNYIFNSVFFFKLNIETIFLILIFNILSFVLKLNNFLRVMLIISKN